jgi:hypothetical protein
MLFLLETSRRIYRRQLTQHCEESPASFGVVEGAVFSPSGLLIGCTFLELPPGSIRGGSRSSGTRMPLAPLSMIQWRHGRRRTPSMGGGKGMLDLGDPLR